MRKRYFLTFCILLTLKCFSQSCLPEGITFDTQSEIDNFQINNPNCTEIEGDVAIGNSDITNLNGLSVLTSIGGSLRLVNNYSLFNLNGLNSLTSIGGDLWIYQNPPLASLSGLDNVTTIGGDFIIQYIPELTSFTGLEKLDSIGGHLGIYDNEALASLAGLESLTSIDSGLSIGHNSALTSIEGLKSLTALGGSIYISSNDAFNSLSGLDNVNAASVKDLNISNNNSLSTCAVHGLCDYLAHPNGTIDIHDNAIGCNNREEVEAACGVSIKQLGNWTVGQMTVKMFPNPASSAITIETTGKTPQNVILSISNINGQQIMTRQVAEQKTTVDLSGLQNGIYFAKITNDRTVMIGKIVKN